MGDPSSVHTGPIMSHRHWIDPDLEMKTTDKEQTTRAPVQLLATMAKSGDPA